MKKKEKRVWTVTMRVEAEVSEGRDSIEELIENALDDDGVLSNLLDVTDVSAVEGDR